MYLGIENVCTFLVHTHTYIKKYISLHRYLYHFIFIYIITDIFPINISYNLYLSIYLSFLLSTSAVNQFTFLIRLYGHCWDRNTNTAGRCTVCVCVYSCFSHFVSPDGRKLTEYAVIQIIHY